jgi:ribonuclease G
MAGIKHKAAAEPVPALLHREMGILGRIARDRLSSGIKKVVVDKEAEYSTLRQLVNTTAPHLIERIELYQSPRWIFKEFGVEQDFENVNQRTVPLPHGGYLVLDEAEALTAIDVNTGTICRQKPSG